MGWRQRIVMTSACAALVMAVAACGKSAHVERTETDPVLTDFQARVERYMTVHEQMEKEAPPMKTTADVSETEAAQRALAARLQVARATAAQGDIFAPPIAARLRQLLNPELRGRGSASTRAAIRDDAPPKFQLKVNDVFPGGPLPTVPPNVLNVLPQLPKELEYRIVDKHLVLRDVQANIVVDYIFDVMCATC
jgi:hypothetical protein